MASLARYLGLAFAAADLLLELDSSWRIVFAMGSHAGVDERLEGLSLRDLVTPLDGGDMAAVLKGLRPGERRVHVPVNVMLKSGGVRPAELSFFALPELRPNLSCAIAFTGAEVAAAPLLDAQAFRDEMRDRLTISAARGRQLSLVLVEIKGLLEAKNRLEPDEMAKLMGKVQALIAQHGPDNATAGLSDERFAILSGAGFNLAGLIKAIDELSTPTGSHLEASGQSVNLSAGRDPLQQFRAVKSALDCFLAAGLPKDEASLRKSFNAVLDETTRSAGRLNQILEQKLFELYYQPVVDLSNDEAAYHEVLVRFDKGVLPGPMIKLAEELAMIERLDAQVADRAMRRLRAPGSERLKLAVNVSGATLLSDAFLERLLSASSGVDNLRSRMILEITESAALPNLEAASRRIKALCEAGFKVSIDDFGAGAASIDYLRALPVTAVKIDGRYVHGVHRDSRAQSIIKHLVGMCSELDYTTVAEMIECEDELAAVTALGVDCGQGWLFGRPEPEPCAPARRTAPRARRVGEKEFWG